MARFCPDDGAGYWRTCRRVYACRSGRSPVFPRISANNLKQIALALLQYEVQYHAFPPAYTVDERGQPLHSWRTLLLPYLERRAVYQQIDFSKPWDDPVNLEAARNGPPMLICPGADIPEGHTTYVAIIAPDSCLQPGQPRALTDITDKMSQTLLVIEVDAAHAVPWMAPRDADEQLLLSLGSDSKLPHRGGINAVMVDGSGHFLESPLTAAELRALVSVAGGDDGQVKLDK